MHRLICAFLIRMKIITIIAFKSCVERYINSHVLLAIPCINQAIHVLLMHGFCTLHVRILGLRKNRRHQQ